MFLHGTGSSGVNIPAACAGGLLGGQMLEGPGPRTGDLMSHVLMQK